MTKYKIGITERGDAGLDLSWTNKLNSVNGAVIITKELTSGCREALLEHKGKVILHATITGWGGTVIEPCVPPAADTLAEVVELVEDGFPMNQVVIRIDPVIPSIEGIDRMLDVLERSYANGFTRFRTSVVDMYPHARRRFKAAGLPLPYGEGFSPSKDILAEVDRKLQYFQRFHHNTRIEACAEPGLTSAVQCGCISSYDLTLLGLEDDDAPGGYQRGNCLCYSGKKELLENKARCPHQCLYCYWRD